MRLPPWSRRAVKTDLLDDVRVFSFEQPPARGDRQRLCAASPMLRLLGITQNALDPCCQARRREVVNVSQRILGEVLRDGGGPRCHYRDTQPDVLNQLRRQ